MKLMNYDKRTLILQNVRTRMQDVEEKPQTYTKTQFAILRRLIKQKGITRQFFDFLLESLFELKDWKQLDYKQMYELIHILTFWDYQPQTEKER